MAVMHGVGRLEKGKWRFIPVFHIDQLTLFYDNWYGYLIDSYYVAAKKQSSCSSSSAPGSATYDSLWEKVNYLHYLPFLNIKTW